MYERTNLLTIHHLLEVTYNIHIEHVDRKVVFLTHGGSSQIHDLQALGVNLIIGNVLELGSCRILLWVGGIDAVYTGTLEHHVSLDFDTAERRTGIGSEVWTACTCREDADIACLHRLYRLPLGVEFADRLHADGSKHLVLNAQGSECAAQCQGIDNGSTHTHLVALDTVETLLASTQTAEDVTTTNHNAYLNAHLMDLLYLLSIITQALWVDAEALLAHQTLAAQFQKNSFKLCHFILIYNLQLTVYRA